MPIKSNSKNKLFLKKTPGRSNKFFLLRTQLKNCNFRSSSFFEVSKKADFNSKLEKIILKILY